MPLQITPENSSKIEEIESALKNISFSSLGDVNFSGVQNGQVPKWDALSMLWIPSDDTGGISDAPNDSRTYTRTFGVWNALEDAKEITDIQTDVSALQTDVGNIQTDVSALQTDVGNIQTDVQVLQTDVSALQTDVAGLELKKLSDVNPNLNPSSGQILTYNGNFWTNLDPSGGIPEAPIDGTGYVRKDEDWESAPIQSDAPNDAADYVRNSNAWTLLANAAPISQFNLDLNNLISQVNNLSLPDLSDVSFPDNPVLSDVLKYNTATTSWEAGKLALGNLSNVFYTTPNNLDVLQFKTSTPAGPAWTPSALTIPTTLTSLTNVVAPTPALNDVLSFDGTNWINAAGGSGTSLATLSDVNFGTLANGDVLSYDLANTEWVNSGLSLTPAALEYFQIRTTSGTGQYGPNTTGEFGVSSALNVFTTAISGTNLIDQTNSTNIITITNGKRIQFLKTGKYKIHFHTYPNDTGQVVSLYSGPTNPMPVKCRSTRASSTGISAINISTILDITANDYLVFGPDVPNAVMQYVQLLIEFLNESNSIINQITNTGSITITSSTGPAEYYRCYFNSASGASAWPAPTTTNGITAASQWLIETQTAFIQDFTNSGAIFQKITNYVGKIL